MKNQYLDGERFAELAANLIIVRGTIGKLVDMQWRYNEMYIPNAKGVLVFIYIILPSQHGDAKAIAELSFTTAFPQPYHAGDLIIKTHGPYTSNDELKNKCSQLIEDWRSGKSGSFYYGNAHPLWTQPEQIIVDSSAELSAKSFAPIAPEYFPFVGVLQIVIDRLLNGGHIIIKNESCPPDIYGHPQSIIGARLWRLSYDLFLPTIKSMGIPGMDIISQ